MSEPAVKTPAEDRSRLPEWARARESERRGRGELRLIETTVLVLVGILFAVATINDVVLQTHTNHRLVADQRTWRTVTGHDYRNISIEQDLNGHTTRDVLCGNTAPGPPGTLPQICLILTGAAHNGLRHLDGGYYLPPHLQDLRNNRYGCFARAQSEELCGLKTPPGAVHALPLKEG